MGKKSRPMYGTRYRICNRKTKTKQPPLKICHQQKRTCTFMTESPLTGYALEIIYHNINYGWVVKDGTVMPAISSQPRTSLELDDVSCSCVSCDQAGCGCKKAKFSCADYCECGAGNKCQIPHTQSTENELQF